MSLFEDKEYTLLMLCDIDYEEFDEKWKNLNQSMAIISQKYTQWSFSQATIDIIKRQYQESCSSFYEHLFKSKWYQYLNRKLSLLNHNILSFQKPKIGLSINTALFTSFKSEKINPSRLDLLLIAKSVLEAVIFDHSKSESYVVEYWDISFNLHDKTLNVGMMYWLKQIRDIDKTIKEFKSLKKNVSTSILLLYCIIRNINENNEFKINKNFSLYDDYIKQYEFQLNIWFSSDKIDMATYVSKLRKILELSSSKYTIRNWSERIFELIG